MEIEYPFISIDKIKPHPENPKEHSADQILQIAESIKGHGWGRPIIISSDFYILAGEGAYIAAKDILKIKEVPYKFLEPKRKHDEPEAISYMLADNNLAEKSDWNYGKLDSNLKELKLKKFNINLSGFDSVDMGRLESNLKKFSKSPWGEGGAKESSGVKNEDDEWEGMPEFNQDDKEGIKLVVHFPTREDVEKFSELIGQEIKETTRYIWYPPQENKSMIDHIYVDK